MTRRLQFSLRFTLLLVCVLALIAWPTSGWLRTYLANRGLVSVRGLVTFQGKPVAGAKVMLMPVNASAKTFQGVTKPDGTYELETLATPGEYNVTIVETGSTAPRVPPKFTTPSTSGLRVSVSDTQENQIDFDLQ